jgi:dipeptidyl aminopeptidase/acylaminoacyl peptidase
MTELSWALSPEGLRIAVANRDRLPEQVRVLDSRNGAERNLQLPHGWRIFNLGWAADGNALFTGARITGYFIARIDLDGKTQVLFDQGRIHPLFFPCPSPDGRHLAFSQRSRETNAWLLENF